MTVIVNIYAEENNNKCFGSTKFSQVTVRTSPNTQSYAKWCFLKKHEPVQILQIFENWREIQDVNGDTGWVHLSCLSKKRFVITTKTTNLYKTPSSATIIANIKSNVRCQLIKQTKSWCKISVKQYTGWVATDSLWGI
ncbi:SH3 domain-containing protein [Candidatus Sneabacter namystus]|uniref:SH3 domain-containing protein n=1 Tax=Candidatus Sneabacter namystus TaxID=2601646 RepID=A0A5C0UJ43_9RICK|nr:SH3 domain-containing protein [Candidatus Sneabacter namystus]QEK39533.1 SH3 domain-containing protein [Candidatus Sneabacter namystus]